MTASLEILRAGPAMSIQDPGRPGYARYGLSAGGAMDPYALAEGAVLLGNPADAAAIEMAGAGGRFRAVDGTLWLALTGAAMAATLDGQTVPWRNGFLLEPGQRLDIGAAAGDADERGTYGYLHVAGGFDTPLEIGARSNHLRAGIGGIDGKPLSTGQILPVAVDGQTPRRRLALPEPEYHKRRVIRILWGPQSSRFGECARQRLLEDTFRVSHRRDRMAMRLDIDSGQPLESLLSGLSDPALAGDIQVTGDGLPAILMCEHQPTGGYPRIATVITADLAATAQLPSGSPFRFELVTRDEAVSALRDWREAIASLANRSVPVIASADQPGNLLDLNLIGGVVSADEVFRRFEMNAQTTIDLNADLGESFGPWNMGDDAAMLEIVTSANIACGFHAGGAREMASTLRLCRDRGVAAGAHPGFDDLRGFGRRRLPVDDIGALQSDLIYQVGAFLGMAAAEDISPAHIKLHGALSNMACEDAVLAEGCIAAFRRVAPGVPVLAQAATHLERAAIADGGPVIREVFADRAYNADGTLVARGTEGAVIHDAGLAAERVLAMIERQSITAIDGSEFAVVPESVCVHGDNPAAVRLAARIRRILEDNHIAVRAPGA